MIKRKGIRRRIALVLAVCLMLCCMPWWDAQQVYAEDPATVYKIYATFPTEGVEGKPSGFEIAESQPTDKGLYGLFIDGGSYTLKNGAEQEDEYNLVIYANNAIVNTDGREPLEYKLSGNSSVNMGTYSISSENTNFPEFDKNNSENISDTKPNIDELIKMYDDPRYVGENITNENNQTEWRGPQPYSYTITADTTWSDWKEIDTLTVNQEAALTITGGSETDENNQTKYWAGGVEVSNAVVDGTVKIDASNEQCKNPNLFAIQQSGSLTVSGNGSIKGEGDAILEIRGGATLNGMKLYERQNESESLIEYNCSNIQDWEAFNFDSQNIKWVRHQGDDNWSGIRIDTRGANVTYQLDSSAEQNLPEDGMIEKSTFENASTITLKITSQDGREIKGLRVRKRIDDVEKISYKQLTKTDNSYIYSLGKDGGSWADYEIEVIDWNVLFDNQYRIIKCSDENLTLSINRTESNWDDGEGQPRSFTSSEAISFTVTGGNIYKVIMNQNDQPERELTGDNGTYNIPLTSEFGFEILVYTSEEQYNYDFCWPDEDREFQVEYQIWQEEENANNTVSYDVKPNKSVTCGQNTKLIYGRGVNAVQLTIQAAEGYHYLICEKDCRDGNHTTECNVLTERVKTSGNVYTWNVGVDDPVRPCIEFLKDGENGEGDPNRPGDNPGDNPPPQNPEDRIKEIIENQRYAFGDWDEDGDVDAEDLKLGMACQIFFPEVNDQNRGEDIRNLYGIQTYGDIKEKITVVKDTNKDIVATDAKGTVRTIAGYTYTVTLDPTPVADQNEETGNENTVTVSGNVYAFDFSDESVYQKNSRCCVIAVTEKNGEENYHLRCANDYAEKTGADAEALVSGNSEDRAIVVVDDFDVTFDKESGEYRRGVSIFGNGAGLDWLLSQEEDTGLVAYQGRNEDFIRDVNGALNKTWDCIFSIFTFCQKDFTGVRVKGSGAEGNTPSWAFNQYPIYSTGASASSENETVVYFGNKKVSIEPVDSLSALNKKVVGIENVTTVDKIPTAAAMIKKESDKKWTIEFKSDFYDNVKVKVVYNLEDGSTVDSYINIHRVGIDILSGGSGGGSSTMTLFHGTENGPSYTPTSKDNFVIWGTYYYPTQKDGEKPVDLYVTYTWADGSITRKTIKNDASLNLAYHHDNTQDCQSSDFILYDGAKSKAPVKIEAIAVASGFDNKTKFVGAKFGAGKGVVWNNYDRKEE